MSNFETFHQQSQPLLLANAWDAESAKRAKLAGYQAIGTSSAAIASVLGYEDGEKMPFEELLFMVKRIVESCSLPLSVDIESGYSNDSKKVVRHIQQLAELGVVGVNIEDSKVEKTRRLVDKDAFSEVLKEITDELKRRSTSVFINVRCDAFLLNLTNAREEAVERAKLYEKAGAGGLFFPCVTAKADIAELVKSTTLPINVMAMPDLPDTNSLSLLGVKRISMGNFAHILVNQQLESTLKEIREQGSCDSLFA
ncbi:isocitrate lyase/PEP mutase family protein [Pseudoalteromonas luteoviolacea]|uniref:isocitrate lyase/PEP mutase family protein n=1 Tax=Pseudoalteromonas luteoviolacea TaxID=43657 RepID=UPI00114D7601|nr:isocitrate lyase/phosphoenolpyruvate mutase family protein [Pseudoalteromonas luteoviolacea]TQF70379.1 isocitrate lyase/phosphoenolpyruvate mutase family protein [Pseudoalteromonas luteoviolacea]